MWVPRSRGRCTRGSGGTEAAFTNSGGASLLKPVFLFAVVHGRKGQQVSTYFTSYHMQPEALLAHHGESARMQVLRRRRAHVLVGVRDEQQRALPAYD